MYLYTNIEIGVFVYQVDSKLYRYTHKQSYVYIYIYICRYEYVELQCRHTFTYIMCARILDRSYVVCTTMKLC